MEEEAVDTAKALRGPLRAHQQPNYDQPSNKSLAERLTFLKGTWTELRLQSPASSLLGKWRLILGSLRFCLSADQEAVAQGVVQFACD